MDFLPIAPALFDPGDRVDFEFVWTCARLIPPRREAQWRAVFARLASAIGVMFQISVEIGKTYAIQAPSPSNP
jgi:hypothetical protein